MPSLRGLAKRGRRLLGLPPVAPTILAYHRVAEPAVDPWGLAVSPAWFERQMAELKRHRSPMPVEELIVRLRRQGTAPRDAVAVTFDDGYLDNLVNAKPVLMRFGIPATLFVATGSIGQPGEFWWDELAKLTIGWPEASKGSVLVAEKIVEWSFPANPGYDGASLSAREDAHRRLWTTLRNVSTPVLQEAMAQLRRAIGTPSRTSLDRVMTEAEIAAWLDGGLTAIAAHTVTHRPLTSISPEELEDEVATSMARCGEIAGETVRGFAYPYGDRNEAVAEAVRSVGIEWACSTHGSAVPAADRVDYFDLPRIQVRNADLRSQWVER